jgi:hypothetical protein
MFITLDLEGVNMKNQKLTFGGDMTLEDKQLHSY